MKADTENKLDILRVLQLEALTVSAYDISEGKYPVHYEDSKGILRGISRNYAKKLLHELCASGHILAIYKSQYHGLRYTLNTKWRDRKSVV